MSGVFESIAFGDKVRIASDNRADEKKHRSIRTIANAFRPLFADTGADGFDDLYYALEPSILASADEHGLSAREAKVIRRMLAQSVEDEFSASPDPVEDAIVEEELDAEKEAQVSQERHFHIEVEQFMVTIRSYPRTDAMALIDELESKGYAARLVPDPIAMHTKATAILTEQQLWNLLDNPRTAQVDRMGNGLKVGDGVVYNRQFLNDTGMLTGDAPQDRGTITALTSLGGSGRFFATVQWDIAGESSALTTNLTRQDRTHLEGKVAQSASDMGVSSKVIYDDDGNNVLGFVWETLAGTFVAQNLAGDFSENLATFAEAENELRTKTAQLAQGDAVTVSLSIPGVDMGPGFPEFIRGVVQKVDGDTVTVGDTADDPKPMKFPLSQVSKTAQTEEEDEKPEDIFKKGKPKVGDMIKIVDENGDASNPITVTVMAVHESDDGYDVRLEEATEDSEPGEYSITADQVIDETVEEEEPVEEESENPFAEKTAQEDDEYIDERFEDDIVTEDHWTFWQDGKRIIWSDDAGETYRTRSGGEYTDMWEALDAHMAEDNFYPNVWFISDHGNEHIMTRESKTAQVTPQVGDILYTSWGYEQTNIEFFQVTRTTKASVELRAIAKRSEEAGAWAQYTVMPIKDGFISDFSRGGAPFLRRVIPSGDSYGVNIDSVRGAWLWKGNPLHETRYAGFRSAGIIGDIVQWFKNLVGRLKGAVDELESVSKRTAKTAKYGFWAAVRELLDRIISEKPDTYDGLAAIMNADYGEEYTRYVNGASEHISFGGGGLTIAGHSLHRALLQAGWVITSQDAAWRYYSMKHPGTGEEITYNDIEGEVMRGGDKIARRARRFAQHVMNWDDSVFIDANNFETIDDLLYWVRDFYEDDVYENVHAAYVYARDNSPHDNEFDWDMFKNHVHSYGYDMVGEVWEFSLSRFAQVSFRAAIETLLDRVVNEKPDTYDGVAAILNADYGEEYASYIEGASNGAFFGGDQSRSLQSALRQAGWVTVSQETWYYYSMKHPGTGEELSYIEGDVIRGNKIARRRRAQTDADPQTSALIKEFLQLKEQMAQMRKRQNEIKGELTPLFEQADKEMIRADKIVWTALQHDVPSPSHKTAFVSALTKVNAATRAVLEATLEAATSYGDKFYLRPVKKARQWKDGDEYIFQPVGWDMFFPSTKGVASVAPGTRVRVLSVPGAPANGTMGNVYVEDVETGEFLGLVKGDSLEKTGFAPRSAQSLSFIDPAFRHFDERNNDYGFFGYMNHPERSPESDKNVLEAQRMGGLSDDHVFLWLTSRPARHYMDRFYGTPPTAQELLSEMQQSLPSLLKDMGHDPSKWFKNGKRRSAQSQGHELVPQSVLSSLPPLYANENTPLKDQIVRVKFFTPDSNWTWYVLEYDPASRMFFGLVNGMYPEFGYFSLDELESVKGPMGLLVERDLHFQPMSVADAVTQEHVDIHLAKRGAHTPSMLAARPIRKMNR